MFKRLLLPLIAILLWAGVSFSAIARTGQCSASATSCTLSAVATGDVVISFAFRTSSTTAPSADSGGGNAFTSITTVSTTNGGTTAAFRVSCKKASSGSDTASGTYANATAVVSISYSGSAVNATSDCNTTGIGGTSNNSAKTSTTAQYNAITINHPSTAWVVGFIGGSASSTCSPTTPVSLTSESATGTVRVSSSEAVVASFGNETCTVSSETWMTYVAEIATVANLTRNVSDQLGGGVLPENEFAPVFTCCVKSVFTINNGMVPSTQTNIPLLIDWQDDRFRCKTSGGHVQSSSGYDLRPYKDASYPGTALSYELVAYTCATGHFQMWVLMPSASDGASIVMRYDDTTLTTDGSSKSNVWANNGYTLVYHHEDAAGASAADSSGNGNDATVTAGTSQSTTGQIDNGANFDTTTWFSTPRSVFGTNSSLTWGGWFFTRAVTQFGFLAKQDPVTPFDDDFTIYFDGNTPNSIRCDITNASGTRVKPGDLAGALGPSYSLNTWYHVVGTYDGSTATCYVNGQVNGSGVSLTGNVRDTVGATINQGVNEASAALNGKVDEIFMKRNVADSQNWVTTQYNNQLPSIGFFNNNSAFWTLSAESLIYPRTGGNDGPATEVMLFQDFVTAIKSAGGTAYVRTVFESLVLADFGVRTLNAVRPVADQLGTVDSATRVEGFVRTASDSMYAVSDKVVRVYGALRPVFDMPGGFEYLSNRRFTGARAVADQLGTADSVVRISGFNRLTFDTMVPADKATRIFNAVRPVVDQLLTADSITQRFFVGARTGADQLASADFLTNRSQGLARAGFDTVVSFESMVRTLSAVRPVFDMPGGFEYLSNRRFTGARAVADQLASADALTNRSQGLARSGFDTVVSFESMVRVANFQRLTYDSIGTFEKIARTFNAFRLTFDQLGTADSVAKSQGLFRFGFDSAGVYDNLTQRSFNGSRLVADQLGAADNLTQRFFTGGRLVADQLAAADSVRRQATNSRAVTDMVVVGDNGIRLFTGSRAVADAMILADSVDRQVNANRHDYTVMTADAGNMFDFASRLVSNARSVSDQLGSADNGIRTASLFRATADALASSDKGTRSFGATRNVFDVSGLSDAASRQAIMSRATFDATGVYDNAIRSQGLTRLASDSLGAVSDSGARTVNAVRHFIELGFESMVISDRPATNKIIWNPQIAPGNLFNMPPRITQWQFTPRVTRFIIAPRVMEWDLSRRDTQFHLSPRVTQFIYQR